MEYILALRASPLGARLSWRLITKCKMGIQRSYSLNQRSLPLVVVASNLIQSLQSKILRTIVNAIFSVSIYSDLKKSILFLTWSNVICNKFHSKPSQHFNPLILQPVINYPTFESFQKAEVWMAQRPSDRMIGKGTLSLDALHSLNTYIKIYY